MVTEDSEWDQEKMDGTEREINCRKVQLDRGNESHAGCWGRKVINGLPNTAPFTLQYQHNRQDVPTGVTAA